VIRVYGVTGLSVGRIGGRGMSGEPLSGVAAGGVRAIVGTAARTSRASVESLQRYDRVVRALWSARPALLPARFGTEFDTLEDLKRALLSRSMSADLRRVRGRAQMIVRVLGATAGSLHRDRLSSRSGCRRRAGPSHPGIRRGPWPRGAIRPGGTRGALEERDNRVSPDSPRFGARVSPHGRAGRGRRRPPRGRHRSASALCLRVSRHRAGGGLQASAKRRGDAGNRPAPGRRVVQR
jgi:hypothetical protein